MEIKQSNGWIEKDAEYVLKEATDRLKEKSWKEVRPALSITVRSVISISPMHIRRLLIAPKGRCFFKVYSLHRETININA